MDASDPFQTNDLVVFRRVLLKLSGESLGRPGDGGIDPTELVQIASEIKAEHDRGVQFGIVVGGGNLLRGAAFSSKTKAVKTATSHVMGMLATVMNGLALRDALEGLGAPSVVTTPVRMDSVAEVLETQSAIQHLEEGRIVILAGGTGSPFVTTDTAAALRGKQLSVDVVLKATRVDGVYSADPEKDPQARLFDELTPVQVLQENLKVMDLTAMGFCLENELPIIVYNYRKTGNLRRVLNGDRIGTWVGSKPRPLGRFSDDKG